jgi:hypothetical protein
VGEELQSIRERGVFIVDDVAFIQAEHSYAIGHEIEKRWAVTYLPTAGPCVKR